MMNKVAQDNIFYIDTSALVRIFRFYPSDLVEAIWDKLYDLFNSNILFSHSLVYDEITTNSKQQDLLSKKIKPIKKYFLPMNFEQAKLVAKIINDFPNLIDATNEKEQADPWIIALAILEQNQLNLFNPNKKVFIISEESTSKQNRIPAVSRNFGLNHLNLTEFYRLNNWSFKLVS